MTTDAPRLAATRSGAAPTGSDGTTARFGVATPGYHPPPLSGASAATSPKRWRRLRVVLTLLLVAGLVAGAFWGGRSTSPTPAPPPRPPRLIDQAVTASELPAGSRLLPSDLREVTVTARSAPDALSFAQAESSVGQRVRRDLPAGSLLTGADLTTSVFPAADQAVVGLDVTAADAPSGGLVAGDTVGVIYVAGASDPPYPKPVALAKAEVWSVGAGSGGTGSGSTSVALLVPVPLASTLSADASHGEITLVRLAPGTSWPTSPIASSKRSGRSGGHP